MSAPAAYSETVQLIKLQALIADARYDELGLEHLPLLREEIRRRLPPQVRVGESPQTSLRLGRR